MWRLFAFYACVGETKPGSLFVPYASSLALLKKMLILVRKYNESCKVLLEHNNRSLVHSSSIAEIFGSYKEGWLCAQRSDHLMDYTPLFDAVESAGLRFDVSNTNDCDVIFKQACRFILLIAQSSTPVSVNCLSSLKMP
jgi:hypothetical protein